MVPVLRLIERGRREGVPTAAARQLAQLAQAGFDFLIAWHIARA